MGKQTKIKAAAFRAVMSNKELAKSIFAGQSAPIGSTKRKKALSILSSVYNEFASKQANGANRELYNGK